MYKEWTYSKGEEMITDFFDQECYYSDGTFTPSINIFRRYQEYASAMGEEVQNSKLIDFSRRFNKVFELKKEKRRIEGCGNINGFIGVALKSEGYEEN